MHINVKKSILFGLIVSILSLNLFFTNCSKVGFPYSVSQLTNQGPQLANNANNCAPKTLKSVQSFSLKMSEKISSRVFNRDPQKVFIQENRIIPKGTRYMVRFNPSCMNNNGANTLLSQIVQANHRQLNDQNIEFVDIEIPIDIDINALQAMVYEDECIQYLDLSEKMKLFQTQSFDDPYFTNQKHLDELKLSSVAPRFFNSKNGIIQPIKVGVVDTGADTVHSDLASLFARDSQSQLIAWPTDGKYDPTTDSGNHGTHVTGLIGAIGNNGIGTVGIMYRNLKIYLAKATDDGEQFYMSDINNALLWQKQQGVPIVNFSIGTTAASDSLKQVLKELSMAGITVVTAAGNSAELLETTPTYPAVWNNEIKGLISVGSYDTATLTLSTFSNYSSQFVDVLAPGALRSSGATAAGLVSTVPNGYQGMMGTSMAAPIVSGALALTKALIESRGISVSNSQLKSILLKSAISTSQFAGKSKNGGKLSLENLIDTIDVQTGIDSKTTMEITNAGGKLEISHQMHDAYAMIGYPAELSVKLSPESTDLVQYQWYKNGIPINGAIESTYIINKSVASDFTTYYVIITSGTKSIQSEAIFLHEASQFCTQ